MRQNGSFGILVFVIIAGLGGVLAFIVNGIAGNTAAIGIGVVAFVVAIIASSAIRVADQWDRAIILRLGQFHALKGPGLFFMIPVVDSIPYWIDIRVITTGFKAEKTLTKDTVPVDVDAVLFWKVIDPKKAALDVAEHERVNGRGCHETSPRKVGRIGWPEERASKHRRLGLSRRRMAEQRENRGTADVRADVAAGAGRAALDVFGIAMQRDQEALPGTLQVKPVFTPRASAGTRHLENRTPPKSCLAARAGG